MSKLTLKSPSFEREESIPEKYTCDGKNLSPPLEIKGVPEEAGSLALVLDDPDAPGQIFDHWVLWNIDPEVCKIEEGKSPECVKGKNDFGKLEYGGPCPPSGTHRYRFKLYALESKIDLPPGSSKEELEEEIEGRTLDKTKLVGFYSKSTTPP